LTNEPPRWCPPRRHRRHHSLAALGRFAPVVAAFFRFAVDRTELGLGFAFLRGLATAVFGSLSAIRPCGRAARGPFQSTPRHLTQISSPILENVSVFFDAEVREFLMWTRPSLPGRNRRRAEFIDRDDFSAIDLVHFGFRGHAFDGLAAISCLLRTRRKMFHRAVVLDVNLRTGYPRRVS